MCALVACSNEWSWGHFMCFCCEAAATSLATQSGLEGRGECRARPLKTEESTLVLGPCSSHPNALNHSQIWQEDRRPSRKAMAALSSPSSNHASLAPSKLPMYEVDRRSSGPGPTADARSAGSTGARQSVVAEEEAWKNVKRAERARCTEEAGRHRPSCAPDLQLDLHSSEYSEPRNLKCRNQIRRGLSRSMKPPRPSEEVVLSGRI